MISASQAFAPQSASYPSITFSYFIINACSVILLLFFCLCMAIIISTIIVLLLLKICECISDALLETLEDDIEEGGVRTLVVGSFLTYQTALNETSARRRERLETYMQDFSEIRRIHKRPSIKLPQIVIYGQDELMRTFCSDCVICLESFIAGEPCQILPPCNHLFHSYCIKDWLKDNVTCPVCRNCLLET
ncbi:hypothetical protein RJT34_29186 [Clitoria ternatea]|uniref:RING-type domain-containing protein n=1 Tax=Clitoria ternatea TaxID=43366 RepID=A0AAN9ID05_CLITE